MGVVVKTGGQYWIDMANLDFDLDSIGRADITSFSSSKIVGYVSGEKVTINGSGFSTDADGYLKPAGTIHSVKLSHAGETTVSVTGLNLSVAKLVDVAESGSEKQLLSLLRSALKGDDKIGGGTFADAILGFDGNDILSGNGGRDKLYGGDDSDKLFGGAGGDKLYGGSGKDTFIFNKASDSAASGTGRDTIFDFSKKQGDKIDLSPIDANSKALGNQSFKFIGDDDFHGKAGELRFTKFSSDTYIQADLNGDRKADFGIHLDDSLSLSKGDFLL